MVVCSMNKWLRFTTKLFIPGSQVSLCQICTTEIITLLFGNGKTRAWRRRTEKWSLNLAKYKSVERD